MFVGMVFNEEYDSTVRIDDNVYKKKCVTSIYNTFIFLQIFNFINCRKVGGKDFNVFENFFHNMYFILVFFGTSAF
jgi:hypothetical protein